MHLSYCHSQRAGNKWRHVLSTYYVLGAGEQVCTYFWCAFLSIVVCLLLGDEKTEARRCGLLVFSPCLMFPLVSPWGLSKLPPQASFLTASLPVGVPTLSPASTPANGHIRIDLLAVIAPWFPCQVTPSISSLLSSAHHTSEFSLPLQALSWCVSVCSHWGAGEGRRDCIYRD